MVQLRFIYDFDRDAAFNMAADQYLLAQTAVAETIYVRFYTWKKPTITLGYTQKADETLQLERLRADNVEWIRRPTGGRAVLHKGDLTYSCIFPRSLEFLGSSVKESYAMITACLKKGLDIAGIESSSHDSYDELLAVKRDVKLPCFLAPNRDEIMVQGRKLVGSAQKRTTSGVLQHGSIPITDEFAELPRYLTISDEDRVIQQRLLLSKSIWINAIQKLTSIESLAQSITDGFLQTWKFEGIRQNWGDFEVDAIRALAQSEEFVSQWIRV